MLASSYRRSLEVLNEAKMSTIAFPCISTGAYGYPHVEAAHVALETTRRWLEKSIPDHLSSSYRQYTSSNNSHTSLDDGLHPSRTTRGGSGSPSRSGSYQSLDAAAAGAASNSPPPRIDRVIFCIHADEDWEAYRKFLPLYFPPSHGEQQDLNEQQHWADNVSSPGTNTPGSPGSISE